MNTPEVLQTLHRGLALATAIYILFLTYQCFSKKWGKDLQRRLILCAYTILAQLAIGIAVILTTLDLPWAVLHLAVGTAMFAFISEARVYVLNAQPKLSSYKLTKDKWSRGRREV
jgi:heme a synthase